MKRLKALRLLDYNQKERKMVWNGNVNDLEKFLTEVLGKSIDDGGLSSNTSSKCTVLKSEDVTINFYPTTKTLQIQGKRGNDLKTSLIDLLAKNKECENDNSVIHQSFDLGRDPSHTNDVELSELESFIDSVVETVGIDKEGTRSSLDDGNKDELDKVWETIKVINSKLETLETITCKLDEARVSMTTGSTKSPMDLTVICDNLSRENELLKSKLVESETEIKKAKEENLSLLTALNLLNTNYLELINKNIISNGSSSQESSEWKLVTSRNRSSSPKNLEKNTALVTHNPFQVLQDHITENTCEKQMKIVNTPSENTSLAVQINDYRLQQKNRYQQEHQGPKDKDTYNNKPFEIQIDDYRSQHRIKLQNKSQKACSNDISNDNQLNRSQDQNQQTPKYQDKLSDKRVLIIGDSIVKNIIAGKIKKACDEDAIVEVKSIRGARVSQVQSTTREWLAEGNESTKDNLIVHVGTNGLVKNSVADVGKSLERLVKEFKPSVDTMAISSVTIRTDNPELTRKVDELNSYLKEMCEKQEIEFINNSNIGIEHLNGSSLHLNLNGDRKLGRNFCCYLRSFFTTEEIKGKLDFRGTYKNHDRKDWKTYLDLVSHQTCKT